MGRTGGRSCLFLCLWTLLVVGGLSGAERQEGRNPIACLKKLAYDVIDKSLVLFVFDCG